MKCGGRVAVACEVCVARRGGGGGVKCVWGVGLW